MATRFLVVIAALLLAFGGGWTWGGWGRFDAEQAERDVKLQVELLRARSAVLEARISLYNVNFGDASRQLGEAQALLEGTRQQLDELGRHPSAAGLGEPLLQVADAQRLAAALDPAANNRAGEAVRGIDRVIAELSPSPPPSPSDR